MDLKYRILWFDDHPKQVDGVEKYVRQSLSMLGIILDITWVESFDDDTINPILRSLSAYSPYDIILVDYDLGKEQRGNAILKKLRTRTNGEMIFYSAEKVKTLRSLLIDDNIDGIYCLLRDGKLGSAVYAIIESTLRRFYHPNYMRGVVIGSVSEMEERFGEMILDLLKFKNMPTQEEIKNSIISSNKFFLETELKAINDATRPIPLERLVKKANLKIKMDILTSLLEKNGGRVALSCLSVLRNFMDEINAPRIEFAHARTQELNGLPIFKERTGKVWDATQMKTLLPKIRTHKNATLMLSDISDDDE
jgi:hypothetical protein